MFRVVPGALAVLEMHQEAFDHRRVFDAGNHLHISTAGFTGLKVRLEHAL